jgi:siroheme synthase
MPGAEYFAVAKWLREGGLPEDLPCVIVSRASGKEQEIRRSTVGRLAGEVKLPAPSLLIVGRVAARVVDEISQKFWDRRQNDSTLEKFQ